MKNMLTSNERQKIRPRNVPRGTHPRSVSRAHAALLIKSFLEHEQSVHSGEGHAVWVIVNYCVENNISYRLDGNSEVGYVIHKI